MGEKLQELCMISPMVVRAIYQEDLRAALGRAPVAWLVGPRQCGKSTLAREFQAEGEVHFFDLEDPTAASALAQPMTTLRPLRGLVVLDEAQRQPDLCPVLRVLADRGEVTAKFLVLSSASPELSRQSAESLAGRVEVVELRGFDLGEVGLAARDDLWVRGGFPRSFLADSDEDSYRWRQNFLATFLERDRWLFLLRQQVAGFHCTLTMIRDCEITEWTGIGCETRGSRVGRRRGEAGRGGSASRRGPGIGARSRRWFGAWSRRGWIRGE